MTPRFRRLERVAARLLHCALISACGSSNDGNTTGTATDTSSDGGVLTGATTEAVTTGASTTGASQGSDTTTAPGDGGNTDGSGGSSTGDGGVVDSGGTGGEAGNCCIEHAGGGCELPEVSDCVCALLPTCCTGDWTSDCTKAVSEESCGSCPGGVVWDCTCDVVGCDAIDPDTLWHPCSGNSDVEKANSLGQGACAAEVAAAGCDAGTCSACTCANQEPTVLCDP